MDKETEVKEKVIDLVARMAYTERRLMGHELSDMVLKCTFAGRACSPM